MRAAIALPSIEPVDADLLLRALAVYEVHRLDIADAYLVALAEATGVGAVVSFDRSIDRVGTVDRSSGRRDEPWQVSPACLAEA